MGLISSAAVVDWAASALADRPDDQTLTTIVSLYQSDYSQLPELLRALGPAVENSLDDAIAMARRATTVTLSLVLDGAISPYEGARTVWQRIVPKVPSIQPEVIQFIAMASEWEDDESHRDEYAEDIRAEARKWVESHR